uniref:Uncharacterized protein n=1 Tax=Molossus molossus TaxID=27622 RepID=A0A7J8GL37_MOLMO|nr:hypothetical protein HJG59_011533 [Molossus molossus]
MKRSTILSNSGEAVRLGLNSKCVTEEPTGRDLPAEGGRCPFFLGVAALPWTLHVLLQHLTDRTHGACLRPFSIRVGGGGPCDAGGFPSRERRAAQRNAGEPSASCRPCDLCRVNSGMRPVKEKFCAIRGSAVFSTPSDQAPGGRDVLGGWTAQHKACRSPCPIQAACFWPVLSNFCHDILGIVQV